LIEKLKYFESAIRDLHVHGLVIARDAKAKRGPSLLGDLLQRGPTTCSCATIFQLFRCASAQRVVSLVTSAPKRMTIERYFLT
jgi:hypothetical protein